MKKPIRIAIIGMGGFAGSHQRDVKVLEEAGECRLVCSCDPAPQKFQEKMTEWEYARRGVKIFDDYLKMLDTCAGELDMAVIPTPVPLHAPMHRACVKHGLAIYLEKPPTLNYAELDEMLAVEEQAAKLTQVGFNHIAEPARHAMKKRLLSGEFGRLMEVGFRGLAARTEKYYQRANWAGRLTLNDRLVLDSGMGNAMAHNVHNILFWAGPNGVMDWAKVEWAESEMYRGRAVQGADTIFLRAGLAGDVRLVSVISHACFNQNERTEWLLCENARIDWSSARGYKISWKDGRSEAVPPATATLGDNHRAYYAYLRGETDRPLTRLADTRPFVQLCDLVYVAAGRIHSIPEKFLQRRILPGDDTESVQIARLAEVADCFIQTGTWPSRQQDTPWAGPGGRAEIGDLPLLRDVVLKMAAG